MVNTTMTSMYPLHTPVQVPLKNKRTSQPLCSGIAMPTGLIVNLLIKEITDLLKGKKSAK